MRQVLCVSASTPSSRTGVASNPDGRRRNAVNVSTVGVRRQWMSEGTEGIITRDSSPVPVYYC